MQSGDDGELGPGHLTSDDVAAKPTTVHAIFPDPFDGARAMLRLVLI